MRVLKPAIACAAISFSCMGTQAADLSFPRPATQTAPLPSGTMNWTGFYVGVNGGYGWGDAVTASLTDPAKSKAVALSSGRPGGFVGGGQAGYNWQSGHWLFGFEADIQYADLGGAIDWGSYRFLGLKNGDGQYFGTVRARLGYAMDRTLIYFTGGFAYGGLIDNSLTGNATSNQGYTLGGGFEYAFTENWTGRFEGLYVNLESKAKQLTLTNSAGTFTVNTLPTDGAGLIRMGVNYKF